MDLFGQVLHIFVTFECWLNGISLVISNIEIDYFKEMDCK